LGLGDRGRLDRPIRTRVGEEVQECYVSRCGEFWSDSLSGSKVGVIGGSEGGSVWPDAKDLERAPTQRFKFILTKPGVIGVGRLWATRSPDP